MSYIIEQFRLNTKVSCGEHSLELLKEVKGSRALVISDAVMEKLGFLEQVKQYLAEAGAEVTVFTGIRPDPDTKVVAEGMRCYCQVMPDILVAMGGGSAIDAAKGILYSVWQFRTAEGSEFEKPHFIAVPSTSGTGSEVTNFSVITAEGDKTCLVDDFIAPDTAILDSSFIRHVPQKVTADTGIDVLVHAIEAYVSTKATDFTDALAEKAAKLIFDYLPSLYENAGDAAIRDRVQNASCLAGMAFTNSGLGIVHSMAHAFGGAFHISHGRSNAMLLDAVMEYNAELSGKADTYAAEKYAKLAVALQLPARTRREGIVSLLDAVRKLKKQLGIEQQVRALGIDETEYHDALERMAQAALADRCTPTSPRQPDLEDIIHIYKTVY